MKNEWFIRDEYAVMLVKGNGMSLEAKVDIADVEGKLKDWPLKWVGIWCQHSQSFYARCNVSTDGVKRHVSLHRFLLEPPPELQVDHINHDTLDNRRLNLRAVDHSTNQRNKKGLSRHNKSGYRGVHWATHENRWRAQLCVRNELVYLGQYARKEDAAEAVKVFMESQEYTRGAA